MLEKNHFTACSVEGKIKKDTFAGGGGVADPTALGEAYSFGQADIEGLQELQRGVEIA